MWKGITPKETKVLIDFHKKYGTRRTRMSKYVDEIMKRIHPELLEYSPEVVREIINKQIKQAQLDVLGELG